jgi:glycosyltransferase involved in cell wall biosynthesis
MITFTRVKQNDVPEVSVRVVTYNHDRFIGRALDSAVNQKTNFPYEIVIGEDLSTDNTREIVKQYQARYPDLIRVNYHESNQGRQFNYYNTLKSCRGRYIALLDGDDYWISDAKLQIQYDFLEAHTEYPLCFHMNRIEWADASRPVRTVSRDKSEYTAQDILQSNYVTPSAAMFRAGSIPEISEVYDNVPFCDWPFYLAIAQVGPLHALQDVLGVKTVQDGGVWTSMSKRDQLGAVIEFYRAVLAEGRHDEAEVRALIAKTQDLLKQRSLPTKLKERLRKIFN